MLDVYLQQELGNGHHRTLIGNAKIPVHGGDFDDKLYTIKELLSSDCSAMEHND